MSTMLDSMLEGNSYSEEPSTGDNVKLQGLARSAALLTEVELHNLVCYIILKLLSKQLKQNTIFVGSNKYSRVSII